VRSPLHLLALAATGVVLIAVTYYVSRSQAVNASWTWAKLVGLAGNAVAIAVVARMFTTFVVAPGIAVMTALLLFRSPTFRGRWMPITVAALSLGVVGPFLAELAGVIAPTYRFADGSVILTSPAMTMEEVPVLAGLLFWVIGSIVIAAVTTHFHAASQRANLVKLELQAWRLRQLVPA
jgi:hypothetical protein